MSEKVTYVHVDPTGRFGFHDADGSLVTIGATPVAVGDLHVPYLDSCPFVKRAGYEEVEDAPEPDLDDQEVDD